MDGFNQLARRVFRSVTVVSCLVPLPPGPSYLYTLLAPHPADVLGEHTHPAVCPLPPPVCCRYFSRSQQQTSSSLCSIIPSTLAMPSTGKPFHIILLLVGCHY
jgi:hypothetical protein